MADAKTKDRKTTQGDTEGAAPIGGPIPEQPSVKEVTQDPADDPAQVEEVKPPKGAYIEDLTVSQEVQVGTADPAGEPRAPAFNDEYVGLGGRYRINPETGLREPVYEKYTDADGEAKFRKAI